MEIVPLIKRGSGCDYHRLQLPYETMGVDVHKVFTEKLGDLLKEAKIVTFNRHPGFDIAHLLSAKKKFGFKIIADVDDYWELYPNHLKYKMWQDKHMKQKIHESIWNADYVFVPTKRLADMVVKLNKNVEVVPNALPFDTGQFAPNPTDSDKFRVIYAGGSSHYWDLFQVKVAFQKISEDRELKKKYEFILAGYNGGDIWNKIEKVFSGYGKLEYRRKNVLPLETYMTHYDDADLSLAPLEDNFFNRFKSNLKVLEAGAKNLPVITSDVPPYSDEKDVFIRADNVREWYTAIKHFILRPDYAKEQGLILGEHVRKYFNLNKVNEIRKQVINHLCT